MLLLVIGLVAVIVAVLVAVFLTRRRRDDDDEPGGRQTVRNRLQGRGRDDPLSTDPRAARKTGVRGPALSRRPAGEPRGYGGPGRGYEAARFDESRGYEPTPRGYGARSDGGRDEQRTERIPAARTGARYPDSPDPAAPAGARAQRAATAPRRAATGTDTGPGTALYDTGPSAAHFSASRVSPDPDLADSDVFPRVRADIPETEAKAKAKAKNPSKGRGRPMRGRHDDDDDDWPSTEWDKLSDEQYWAELSADKPLATTARTAQPSAAAPPAKPAPAAKTPRVAAQPPGRAAGRPQPALDAEPDSGRRRQPPGRPVRTGSRPGTPRRSDDADTDPGRAGLADRPGAVEATATERLPARNRRQPGADPAPSSPAPFMPAGPEMDGPSLARLGQAGGRPAARGPARADDDPLTSPSYARGAAAAEDSRSYRTPSRSSGPRPGGPGSSSPGSRGGSADELSGGYPGPAGGSSYPGPAGGNSYPGAADGYPSAAGGYPVSYPTPPGGYPATGRDAYTGSGNTGPVNTGPVNTGPASTGPLSAGPASTSPARGRGGYAGQSGDAYPGQADGYEPYPGAPGGGGQDYPASGGRHGYPASQADRTDPGAARTDPGSSRASLGARTTPGRRRAAPARQAAPSTPAHTGYPASPAASAPGWGTDRGAAAETPSAQAGTGNPYGSYVDMTPPAATPTPAPAPASHARTAPPAAAASAYPPGQQATGDTSYSGYTTGPSAAYSDPYGSGHGGYPANGQQPADSRAEPGTSWYSAPPPAPAGTYAYQDPSYPAAADYAGQPGYPGSQPGASRDDTRYRSGQTDDPYRPDGYSGYHSRQG